MPHDQESDDDWENPDEEWADDGDDDTTVQCPYCRHNVYEDAERCPHCERYLSSEDAPPQAKPWWIVGGVVACLLVTYLWITCR